MRAKNLRAARGRLFALLRVTEVLIAIFIVAFLLSACAAENPYPDWTPEIDF